MSGGGPISLLLGACFSGLFFRGLKHRGNLCSQIQMQTQEKLVCIDKGLHRGYDIAPLQGNVTKLSTSLTHHSFNRLPRALARGNKKYKKMCRLQIFYNMHLYSAHLCLRSAKLLPFAPC
jgi:hypothetical protein